MKFNYFEFVYLVTDFPASDVLADGLDGARAFEAEELAGALGWRVKALPLESVGPVERCRRDSDQNVVVSHLRVFHLQQLQNLGTAGASDYYGLHCGCSRGRMMKIGEVGEVEPVCDTLTPAIIFYMGELH